MANTTAVVTKGLQRQPRLNSRYRILANLGSSSFGPVCAAVDTTTGSPVAIRLLPSTLARARGGDVLDHISPAIAASRAHPTLVRVLETGRAPNGRPFVVTEFVEGHRLSDVLAKGPRPDVPVALAMALELGGAIETAHNMGLVHGALRTRNVMVLADGRVKLMDLELAKLRDSPPIRLAGAEPLAVTPPGEQLRDEVITEKTDILSFASMIYEMLCGTRAFEAVAGDAAAAGQTPPVWPRDSRAKIPRSVRRIIEQALNENPQRRPFMSELLNGLVLKSSVTPRSRRRIAIVGSVTVATLSACLLGWGLLRPREPVVKRPEYATRPVSPTAAEMAPIVPAASSTRSRGPTTPSPAPTRVPTPVPASRIIATPSREAATSRESAPLLTETLPPATGAVPTHPASSNDEPYDPAAVIDWVLSESRR